MKKAQRDAYGHALVELGSMNASVVVFDADLSRGTRTNWFQEKFPDRFFNIGIAEQNMIGMASGIALTGKIPFVTTYSIFISRAFDQIRQSVSFTRSNVKIVATHSGFSAAFDGGSHQGLEDLAIMRVLPGMTILSPADYNEARQAIFAAAKFQGPVYIRIGKFDQPVITSEETPFVIGKAHVMVHGSDVAIFSTGSLVAEALVAAKMLEEENIKAEVINISTIKPLDEETLLRSAGKCGCVVTAEEHNKIGGLFSAVSELICSNLTVPVSYVAVNDVYGETGSWEELLNKHMLTAAGIVNCAKEILLKK